MTNTNTRRNTGLDANKVADIIRRLNAIDLPDGGVTVAETFEDKAFIPRAIAAITIKCEQMTDTLREVIQADLKGVDDSLPENKDGEFLEGAITTYDIAHHAGEIFLETGDVEFFLGDLIVSRARDAITTAAEYVLTEYTKQVAEERGLKVFYAVSWPKIEDETVSIETADDVSAFVEKQITSFDVSANNVLVERYRMDKIERARTLLTEAGVDFNISA